MHIPGKSILLVISRIERSLAQLIRDDHLYLLKWIHSANHWFPRNAVLKKFTVKKTSKVARAHARVSYYKFCFEVFYIWVLIDFRFNFIKIIHNERWNIYMLPFIVTKTCVCDICWFTSMDKSYIIHSFLGWWSLVSGFILRHVVFLHGNMSQHIEFTISTYITQHLLLCAFSIFLDIPWLGSKYLLEYQIYGISLNYWFNT
jgi:hypothetical protein